MGQVTGIGSLPHTAAEEAVRFVAEHSPAIPFWPQLPRRSEDEGSIRQGLTPLLDIVLPLGAARYEIPRHQTSQLERRLHTLEARWHPGSAAGFFAFERACRTGLFRGARALKGQMTGIVTLAHCLFVDGKPLVANTALMDALTDYLCRLGVWQIERLQQFNKPVLLFIDEPALHLGSFAPNSLSCLNTLVQTLRATGASVGIHCCAASQPDLLCQITPDIISFDAHQWVERFLSSPAVRRFVSSGGWLAFGTVPTVDNLSQFEPMQALMRLITAAEGHYDLDQLATQCLITATCGLGLVSQQSAQESFEKSAALSQGVQRIVRTAQA